MNVNVTLKNLTSDQNLLLFWLSNVASGTFFRGISEGNSNWLDATPHELSLLRFNCIYKSFRSVQDLLKKASLKKAKTARLTPR